MVLIPVGFNAIQFWILDEFLRHKRQEKEAASIEEKKALLKNDNSDEGFSEIIAIDSSLEQRDTSTEKGKFD